MGLGPRLRLCANRHDQKCWPLRHAWVWRKLTEHRLDLSLAPHARKRAWAVQSLKSAMDGRETHD